MAGNNTNFDALVHQLAEAISSGNEKEAQRIRELMNYDLDEEIAKSFMQNIRGKKVHQNLKKFLEDTLPTGETIKMLMSLMTHYLIELEQSDQPLSDYTLSTIYAWVGDLLRGEEGAEDGVKEFLTKKFGTYLDS